MTLRLRLISASALILTLVIVGAIVLYRVQLAFLLGQVDERLDRNQRFMRPSVPNLEEVVSASDAGGSDVVPLGSDMFVAVALDGEVTTVQSGRLLEDAPELDIDELERHADGDPFTISGVAGDTSFRAAVVTSPSSPAIVVVAVPLSAVESTAAQLRLALGLGVVLIAGATLASVWWVERLGLRPIAQLTLTADAVARGERALRTTVDDRRTEAGRLGHAFNVMLDEVEASEGRLRQFVADASHELRTPLTSIQGYLDLWRDGGFRGPGDLDDIVRRMSQESGRMTQLVEDLLLLSHLDLDRPLRHELVDVDELLRDAASDAGVLQPTRPIEVEADGEGGSLTITADRYRLQQVLAGLVDNALFHTDAQVGLRLSAVQANGHVTLTVTDDGPGMSPEDAARAFDRFFRGERSRARRTGGSGLGLAIARSIVQAHGGTIALDTAPGHGCTVRIDLPRTPPGAGEPPVARVHTPLRVPRTGASDRPPTLQ